MDEQHREADGNHHEGSSSSSSSPKRLRHRLTSALFIALGIKRSIGGTVSSGNEKSKKIEVSEHGCYISDRRESPRSASNSSSCFSLWDDEGARSLSMERQIEMLDGNDELNEPNSSTRLSNSSADSEVIGLHAPLYTFLKGIEIEEEEDPAGSESKEPNGETVVVGRMTKRMINIKDLKFPQLSSLLSPAILSFHKIRMARRFFSNLGSNHKAGMMNLNVKKMLLDAFGGRKRLMANVSGGEQLWDKRILMGNKCRPLDFSSSPSHDDECSIQVMEELAIEGMSVSSSSSHLKE